MRMRKGCKLRMARTSTDTTVGGLGLNPPARWPKRFRKSATVSPFHISFSVSGQRPHAWWKSQQTFAQQSPLSSQIAHHMYMSVHGILTYIDEEYLNFLR